jgi:hypothetical protein
MFHEHTNAISNFSFCLGPVTSNADKIGQASDSHEKRGNSEPGSAPMLDFCPSFCVVVFGFMCDGETPPDRSNVPEQSRRPADMTQ